MSSGPSPAPPGNLPPRSSAEPPRRGGRRGRRGGADRERPPQDAERSTLRTQMQKTKMCEFFLNGKCKYGADCAFAHHESEIRNAPDLKKTRLCHAFSKGRCDDSDCNFAHGQEELRTTDFCFKKTLCMWHSKGTCANGERCRFAHGKPDLRSGGEDEPSEPRRPGGQRKRKRAPGRSATQPRVRNKAKRKDGIARSGFAMRALKHRAGRGRDSSSSADACRPQGAALLCDRCFTTVATHLGMVACPLCFNTRFVPDS